MNAIAELTDVTDRSLLIVEDDKPFLERLSRAMETRGFAVTSCDTVTDGLAQINKAAPAFAVVDLRLGDGNGLDVVSALKRKRPEARTIVLTGYGNIATAVTAVKMGAVDYLSKPADADDVVAAHCLPAAARSPSCRRTRCLRIACAGNTSSASTRCATATSRKRRVGLTCTGARCSGFWPSARRGKLRSFVSCRVGKAQRAHRSRLAVAGGRWARFALPTLRHSPQLFEFAVPLRIDQPVDPLPCRHREIAPSSIYESLRAYGAPALRSADAHHRHPR